MSIRLSAGERALSRWHRLRHTPLRDVLRGRISGRLDIDQVIRAATLPEQLAQLARSTTLRTRLWRLEKVDVARELAAGGKWSFFHLSQRDGSVGWRIIGLAKARPSRRRRPFRIGYPD